MDSLRGLLFLLLPCVLPAQSPVNNAIQDYNKARAEAHFDDAVAKRLALRQSLENTSVDPSQVRNVARLYEDAGMRAQARAIVLSALDRSETVGGETHPARIELNRMMADSWLRDRNLLKSLAYREKAVAWLERWQARKDLLEEYQKLADLYRKLGRRDSELAVLKKIRAIPGSGPAVGIYLNLSGRYEEAASVLTDQIAALSEDKSVDAADLLTQLRQMQAYNLHMLGHADDAQAVRHQLAATPQVDRTQQRAVSGPEISGPVTGELRLAQSEINSGNVDGGFGRTMRVLESALHAPDRNQVGSFLPGIATALTKGNAADKAEQLYQRALGILAGWSNDSLKPVLAVQESYVSFLKEQNGRATDFYSALEQYKALLVSAHGEGSGLLWEILHSRMRYESSRGSKARGIELANDAMTLEESLSGKTSQPYVAQAADLAELYEANGEPARAIELYLGLIPAVDSNFHELELIRGSIRASAALALARSRRYEEAERFAGEAAAMGKLSRPVQPAFADVPQKVRETKQRMGG